MKPAFAKIPRQASAAASAPPEREIVESDEKSSPTGADVSTLGAPSLQVEAATAEGVEPQATCSPKYRSAAAVVF